MRARIYYGEEDLLGLAIEARTEQSNGALAPDEPTRYGHALYVNHLLRCPLQYGERCRYCERLCDQNGDGA